MIYLGDNPVGVTLKSDPDAWVKPKDWPDIESLPLPSDNKSCMYFLYDCETEVRYAMFTYTYNKADLSIAKCENGIIGEFSNATKQTLSTAVAYVPLPDDCKWAVIKLDGTYNQWCFSTKADMGLYYLANNVGSNQPCVWEYGKIFSDTPAELYQNGTAGIASIPLERVRLYLTNVYLGYGYSTTMIDSIVINDEDMHGGLFPFLSSATSAVCPSFILRNGTIVATGNKKIFAFNINQQYVDISGLSSNEDFQLNCSQICQSARALKKFIMRTNGIKISDLYYAFNDTRSVELIDLTGCDLSECTRTLSMFAENRALTDLWLGDGLTISLNLSPCAALSHDSLVHGVLERLGETTEGTLTLNQISKAKLSSDELAIATEKGWTVT